ncbi:MAG: MBL fold metallo-hydrolase, partial [Selenomonas sp.]|nr:MBL fold metallo-hydrolase [Selenomonas sp.]
MEATYLLNSGFLVRVGEILLVFDVFDDPAGVLPK